MYIIRIGRRQIHIILLAVSCLCLILLISIFLSGSRESIGSFLASSDNQSKVGAKQIELFDIEAGRVIARYDSSPVFRKEALKYLSSITGMYSKINAIPKRGYIVKIPLEPPVETSVEWLLNSGITRVEEIFVMFPLQEEPYLLILDNHSRPLCFNFNEDTATLRKYFSEYLGNQTPSKPPEHSDEGQFYNNLMTALLPRIYEAIGNYYEINTGRPFHH